jgi:hypothetical protein
LPAEVGGGTSGGAQGTACPATKLKPSSLLDTRVVCCGNHLEQLKKLPDGLFDIEG